MAAKKKMSKTELFDSLFGDDARAKRGRTKDTLDKRTVKNLEVVTNTKVQTKAGTKFRAVSIADLEAQKKDEEMTFGAARSLATTWCKANKGWEVLAKPAEDGPLAGFIVVAETA